MSTPVISRRRLLGAGLAAGAVIAGESLLAPFAGAASASGSNLGALSDLITKDPDLHVARRCTYGISPAVHAAIKRQGIPAWIHAQLSPATIDDACCDRYLARYPLLGLGPAEVTPRLANGSYDQMQQLSSASLVRAVWSERQLYELMVEFWWNHFNLGLPDSDVWNLCGGLDNVIRTHALGRFDRMLHAVAESPAMLVRLNQNDSVGSMPNENYARELLELHTVGISAGYTEHDVHEAALLLSGWGLSANRQMFSYHPGDHHIGPLTVMGFSTPNSSAADGAAVIRSYLTYLAHHPATATHLARKLAVRFVSDTPSAELVASLASTYLAHGTAIGPMLEKLLASSEFAGSVGKKVRRPIEAMAASLRVLDYALANTGTSDIEDLVFSLEIAGQAPLGWPEPNGYPDTADAWRSASAVQAAWGNHLRLTGGWWTKTLSFPGIVRLLGTPSPSLTGGAFVDRVCRRLLAQDVSEVHRAAFLAFLGVGANQAVGPVLVGPNALPLFAKVVLDAPYFAVR